MGLERVDVADLTCSFKVSKKVTQAEHRWSFQGATRRKGPRGHRGTVQRRASLRRGYLTRRLSAVLEELQGGAAGTSKLQQSSA